MFAQRKDRQPLGTNLPDTETTKEEAVLRRQLETGGRITDVVILSCAISAGIHAALVPEHLDEGTGPGLGFVVSTLLLGLAAVALTRRPTQRWLAVAAAVLSSLIVAYALAATTGLPVLHPESEAVDGLALFTKAVEAVGLIAATALLRLPALPFASQPKGRST